MISKNIKPTSQLDISKRGMFMIILARFLGSGKTTLLNRIRKNLWDLKVAFLVNESDTRSRFLRKFQFKNKRIKRSPFVIINREHELIR
jgi:Ni2+-binding GTPase involved in maturation of urease and hydrogenase